MVPAVRRPRRRSPPPRARACGRAGRPATWRLQRRAITSITGEYFAADINQAPACITSTVCLSGSETYGVFGPFQIVDFCMYASRFASGGGVISSGHSIKVPLFFRLQPNPGRPLTAHDLWRSTAVFCRLAAAGFASLCSCPGSIAGPFTRFPPQFLCAGSTARSARSPRRFPRPRRGD